VKSPRPLKPYQTDRFFDNRITTIVGGLPRLHPCSILALQRLVREFTALQEVLPSVGGGSVGPQGHVVPQGTGPVREPSPAAAAPLTFRRCPRLAGMRLSSRPVPPAVVGRVRTPAVTCAPHRRSPWDQRKLATPAGRGNVDPSRQGRGVADAADWPDMARLNFRLRDSRVQLKRLTPSVGPIRGFRRSIVASGRSHPPVETWGGRGA